MEINWCYKFIVYSKQEQKLLLSSSSERLSLPYFQPSIQHVAVSNHINEYFEKEFQVKTNVLKCFLQMDRVRIYVVEVLEGSPLLSSNALWLQLSNFNQCKELNDTDRSILEIWLSASLSSAFPWFEFGWRRKMEEWVQKMLPHDSLEFEQIRSWERSTLFRVQAENESYYFKAVPDVFSHEPAVSRYLFENHPSYVPEILGIEIEQKWFIMKEVGGSLLGYTDHLEYWRQSLLRLAHIQKESIFHTNELKKLNCPIRPVSQVIRSHLKASLDDLVRTREISSETYWRLKDRLPNILEKCDLLEKHSKLPLALEHGDFFGGNIKIQEENAIIFDWSDCSLSHPFLSVIVLLDEVKQLFSERSAEILLEDYLCQWSNYGTRAYLLEEYRMLKTLAPAYYLVLYQTFIFPTFRDNWDKQQIIEDYIEKWLNP
ncbi:phosphotransferase [Robertmurraya andreesenii]|uniref:Aminoglycoside phosphotransferase domain-containing protein n=1 Tax=Anoxybacillus andreesenii TaxID=1325932 RepID=A0ABT9V925_9BACL|nr:phosphotransferase [Robertmurraya andreesenii]MDQ0157463.1 hypothetical protein [Robertmurraya andreesenii]